MAHTFFDENQVRYKLMESHEGKPYNWLFFPGGPGGDSCYFQLLTQHLKLPGNTWFLDLPGNGSNTCNIPEDYDYDKWFDVFLPAVQKFANPIIVGHSFGAMFPLLYPELEKCLKGFVILNSSPRFSPEEAVSYAKQFNVPDLSKEMGEFTINPNQATFEAALNACMPYYFPQKTVTSQ